MTIDRGSFFTLLGPSGSGKTTTLMMMAGFAYPTRGEVFVDGKPVAGLPPQKRELGMVFQSYAVFPHLTVFDNIAFPLADPRRASGRDPPARRRDRSSWSGSGATSSGCRASSRAASSSGWRWRGRSSSVPRVLLMDEPLGALDKKLRAHMQLELKHIQRHLHVTVIYVTHDQEEALTMSDRVAVMQRGRIEQVGSAGRAVRGAGRRASSRTSSASPTSSTASSSERRQRALAGPLRRRARVPPASAPTPLQAGAAGDGRGAAGEARDRRRCAPAPRTSGRSTRARARSRRPSTWATRPATASRLGADGVMTVKVPNRLGLRQHAEGESVALAWSPDETRIFARDGRMSAAGADAAFGRRLAGAGAPRSATVSPDAAPALVLVLARALRLPAARHRRPQRLQAARLHAGLLRARSGVFPSICTVHLADVPRSPPW